MPKTVATRHLKVVTAVALLVFMSASVVLCEDEPAAPGTYAPPPDSLEFPEADVRLRLAVPPPAGATDSLSIAPDDTVGTAGGAPRASSVPDSLAAAAPDSLAASVPDSLTAAVPDSLSGEAPDTTAVPRPLPPVLLGGVGFRVPFKHSMSFVRPWTARQPLPGRGLRPGVPRATWDQLRNMPFERMIEIDLETETVYVVTEAGDHLAYATFVTDLPEFRRSAGREEVRARWRSAVLPTLGSSGSEQAGGFLDIDIPMPLPGPFVRAIGPGANLKVRGSERITFGGQTSYVVDALDQESGPASRFPQLDMEQQLSVNLEGTIGRKIHVYVDHRSGGDAFSTSKANQIRVRYEGDEDEIIQRIELGEVNLSLPGTEFVSYSGHHEGLFGAKLTGKIGKLDFVTIASKEEGKSAGASFAGGAESDSLVINDIQYKANTFYAPDSSILKTTEEFRNLVVYVDDRDGSNDIETGAVQGRAFLDSPADTAAPGGVYQLGRFDELIELEDYVLPTDKFGVQVGILEFLRPISENSVMAVRYETSQGRVVGGVGANGKLRLKMVKKDGGVDQDWEPIRSRELKNVYDLGADDIPELGFELKIRKRSSTGEDLDVNAQGVPYLQLLGLDSHDLSGNPTPDNIVDFEYVDFENGYLVFPHYTPFCPAYDENDNFYYNAGDTLHYQAFARGLDPYNCFVYSKETFDPSDDVYYVQVNYDRPKTTFTLGHINIIENSEVVRVNGVRLTRGTDYTIYYPAGQLTLLAEEAKDPEAKVTVDYDYKPFGVGGEKTLLGARGVYNWSENIQLGTTWMYQSKGTPDDRPRLGEEPSRTVVGDVNLAADFQPDFMTRMADAIPLVDTDAPSHLKISAETAVSIPEPNTKGFVSIDDMEGVESIAALGVSRRLWVPSSIPVDEAGAEAVAAADREYINWYNPDRLVRRGELFPYLPDQEFDDIHTVLALRDYHADTVAEPWGGGDWAGLMRLLSKAGNDYSKYQFFEFWIDAGADPQGTVHIDLGTVSEDYYPLRAPNGELDTEDYDRNGFDADEDTGLDNCCNTGQCASQEPGCVENTQPSDDYAYDYQGDPDNYRKINGTENNDRLDTEDLNGNYYIDTENRYWELTVDLSDDTYLVQDNNTYEDPAKRTDWRLYRIPLDEALAIGGIQSWEIIKAARIWFEGLDVADEHVLIGSLDIVGSQWEPGRVRDENGVAVPEDQLAGADFRVTAKNTKEDADYSPPFEPGVDEDTGLLKREQSLVLQYENLRPGHQAAARRLLFTEENYTRYGSLKFYVHGENEVEDGTVFFVRIGADSLNYYEYSLELRPGWVQDVVVAGKSLTLPFTSFTNLKLDEYAESDTVFVWGDTTSVKGERFARIGQPSLSRVRQMSVGVRNARSTGMSNEITGEIWVDDMRLIDVRKEIGWAKRATVDAKFADLASVRFDLRHVDGDFHTLKQTQGSGQDNLSYNVNGTVNVDRFASGLGVAAPVAFAWKKSVTRPQFSSGSDVVLSEEQSDDEKTESLDTSVAASLSRKRQSAGFWTHLLVDGLSLRASVAENKRLSPTRADTGRTVRGRLAYKYNPTRQGFRVFREARLFLKPTSVRFSVDGHVSHSLSYDVSSVGVQTKRTDNFDKKLNGEGHVDFQFLENVKTSHSVSFVRDLAQTNKAFFERNIGVETERRYGNSLTFNAKFGRWLAPQYRFTSSFTDDHGPQVRQPGDPFGIRNVRGQSNQEIGTSFDLKKLLGTGPSKAPSRPEQRDRGDERERAPRETAEGTDPWTGGSEPVDADDTGTGGSAAVDPEDTGSGAVDAEDSGAGADEGDGADGSADGTRTQERAPDGGTAGRDDAGDAVVTPDGEQAAGDATDGPGFSVLFDPVLSFLRAMDAIDVQYGLKRSSRYNRISEGDMPGWAYRLGIETGEGADEWADEHNVSVGSGVRLSKDIKISGDYRWNKNGKWSRTRNPDTGEFYPATRTEGMNESTKGSVSWSGVEKVGALSGMFRSIRARSGVEYKRGYSGPYGDPKSRSKAMLLSPIVSLDTTFKNGVTTSFSWDRKKNTSFNLTGTGSVTEDVTGTMSVSMNYRFSAPQGLKLPFFGQKLRFQSNLDTSLTFRTSAKETRTAATEEGLVVAEPTAATRDFSVTADATYSFSRSVSGGLQFSFAQSKDEKRDQTRRTIGVHLTAEFKF
ncbi:MAG: cell surface protein SprA [Candidatus Eisenbacteria bacterium]